MYTGTCVNRKQLCLCEVPSSQSGLHTMEVVCWCVDYKNECFHKYAGYGIMNFCSTWFLFQELQSIY